MAIYVSPARKKAAPVKKVTPKRSAQVQALIDKKKTPVLTSNPNNSRATAKANAQQAANRQANAERRSEYQTTADAGRYGRDQRKAAASTAAAQTRATTAGATARRDYAAVNTPAPVRVLPDQAAVNNAIAGDRQERRVAGRINAGEDVYGWQGQQEKAQRDWQASTRSARREAESGMDVSPQAPVIQQQIGQRQAYQTGITQQLAAQKAAQADAAGKYYGSQRNDMRMGQQGEGPQYRGAGTISAITQQQRSINRPVASRATASAYTPGTQAAQAAFNAPSQASLERAQRARVRGGAALPTQLAAPRALWGEGTIKNLATDLELDKQKYQSFANKFAAGTDVIANQVRGERDSSRPALAELAGALSDTKGLHGWQPANIYEGVKRWAGGAPVSRRPTGSVGAGTVDPRATEQQRVADSYTQAKNAGKGWAASRAEGAEQNSLINQFGVGALQDPLTYAGLAASGAGALTGGAGAAGRGIEYLGKGLEAIDWATDPLGNALMEGGVRGAGAVLKGAGRAGRGALRAIGDSPAVQRAADKGLNWLENAVNTPAYSPSPLGRYPERPMPVMFWPKSLAEAKVLGGELLEAWKQFGPDAPPSIKAAYGVVEASEDINVRDTGEYDPRWPGAKVPQPDWLRPKENVPNPGVGWTDVDPREGLAYQPDTLAMLPSQTRGNLPQLRRIPGTDPLPGSGRPESGVTPLATGQRAPEQVRSRAQEAARRKSNPSKGPLLAPELLVDIFNHPNSQQMGQKWAADVVEHLNQGYSEFPADVMREAIRVLGLKQTPVPPALDRPYTRTPRTRRDISGPGSGWDPIKGIYTTRENQFRELEKSWDRDHLGNLMTTGFPDRSLGAPKGQTNAMGAKMNASMADYQQKYFEPTIPQADGTSIPNPNFPAAMRPEFVYATSNQLDQNFAQDPALQQRLLAAFANDRNLAQLGDWKRVTAAYPELKMQGVQNWLVETKLAQARAIQKEHQNGVFIANNPSLVGDPNPYRVLDDQEIQNVENQIMALEARRTSLARQRRETEAARANQFIHQQSIWKQFGALDAESGIIPEVPLEQSEFGEPGAIGRQVEQDREAGIAKGVYGDWSNTPIDQSYPGVVRKNMRLDTLVSERDLWVELRDDAQRTNNAAMVQKAEAQIALYDDVIDEEMSEALGDLERTTPQSLLQRLTANKTVYDDDIDDFRTFSERPPAEKRRLRELQRAEHDAMADTLNADYWGRVLEREERLAEIADEQEAARAANPNASLDIPDDPTHDPLVRRLDQAIDRLRLRLRTFAEKYHRAYEPSASPPTMDPTLVDARTLIVTDPATGLKQPLPKDYQARVSPATRQRRAADIAREQGRPTIGSDFGPQYEPRTYRLKADEHEPGLLADKPDAKILPDEYFQELYTPSVDQRPARFRTGPKNQHGEVELVSEPDGSDFPPEQDMDLSELGDVPTAAESTDIIDDLNIVSEGYRQQAGRSGGMGAGPHGGEGPNIYNVVRDEFGNIVESGDERAESTLAQHVNSEARDQAGTMRRISEALEDDSRSRGSTRGDYQTGYEGDMSKLPINAATGRLERARDSMRQGFDKDFSIRSVVDESVPVGPDGKKTYIEIPGDAEYGLKADGTLGYRSPSADELRDRAYQNDRPLSEGQRARPRGPQGETGEYLGMSKADAELLRKAEFGEGTSFWRDADSMLQPEDGGDYTSSLSDAARDLAHIEENAWKPGVPDDQKFLPNGDVNPASVTSYRPGQNAAWQAFSARQEAKANVNLAERKAEIALPKARDSMVQTLEQDLVPAVRAAHAIFQEMQETGFDKGPDYAKLKGRLQTALAAWKRASLEAEQHGKDARAAFDVLEKRKLTDSTKTNKHAQWKRRQNYWFAAYEGTTKQLGLPHATVNQFISKYKPDAARMRALGLEDGPITASLNRLNTLTDRLKAHMATTRSTLKTMRETKGLALDPEKAESYATHRASLLRDWAAMRQEMHDQLVQISKANAPNTKVGTKTARFWITNSDGTKTVLNLPPTFDARSLVDLYEKQSKIPITATAAADNAALAAWDGMVPPTPPEFVPKQGTVSKGKAPYVDAGTAQPVQQNQPPLQSVYGQPARTVQPLPAANDAEAKLRPIRQRMGEITGKDLPAAVKANPRSGTVLALRKELADLEARAKPLIEANVQGVTAATPEAYAAVDAVNNRMQGPEPPPERPPASRQHPGGTAAQQAEVASMERTPPPRDPQALRGWNNRLAHLRQQVYGETPAARPAATPEPQQPTRTLQLTPEQQAKRDAAGQAAAQTANRKLSPQEQAQVDKLKDMESKTPPPGAAARASWDIQLKRLRVVVQKLTGGGGGSSGMVARRAGTPSPAIAHDILNKLHAADRLFEDYGLNGDEEIRKRLGYELAVHPDHVGILNRLTDAFATRQAMKADPTITGDPNAALNAVVRELNLGRELNDADFGLSKAQRIATRDETGGLAYQREVEGAESRLNTRAYFSEADGEASLKSHGVDIRSIDYLKGQVDAYAQRMATADTPAAVVARETWDNFVRQVRNLPPSAKLPDRISIAPGEPEIELTFKPRPAAAKPEASRAGKVARTLAYGALAAAPGLITGAIQNTLIMRSMGVNSKSDMEGYMTNNEAENISDMLGIKLNIPWINQRAMQIAPFEGSVPGTRQAAVTQAINEYLKSLGLQTLGDDRFLTEATRRDLRALRDATNAKDNKDLTPAQRAAALKIFSPLVQKYKGAAGALTLDFGKVGVNAPLYGPPMPTDLTTRKSDATTSQLLEDGQFKADAIRGAKGKELEAALLDAYKWAELNPELAKQVAWPGYPDNVDKSSLASRTQAWIRAGRPGASGAKAGAAGPATAPDISAEDALLYAPNYDPMTDLATTIYGAWEAKNKPAEAQARSELYNMALQDPYTAMFMNAPGASGKQSNLWHEALRESGNLAQAQADHPEWWDATTHAWVGPDIEEVWGPGGWARPGTAAATPDAAPARTPFWYEDGATQKTAKPARTPYWYEDGATQGGGKTQNAPVYRPKPPTAPATLDPKPRQGGVSAKPPAAPPVYPPAGQGGKPAGGSGGAPSVKPPVYGGYTPPPPVPPGKASSGGTGGSGSTWKPFSPGGYAGRRNDNGILTDYYYGNSPSQLVPESALRQSGGAQGGASSGGGSNLRPFSPGEYAGRRAVGGQLVDFYWGNKPGELIPETSLSQASAGGGGGSGGARASAFPYEEGGYAGRQVYNGVLQNFYYQGGKKVPESELGEFDRDAAPAGAGATTRTSAYPYEEGGYAGRQLYQGRLQNFYYQDGKKVPESQLDVYERESDDGKSKGAVPTIFSPPRPGDSPFRKIQGVWYGWDGEDWVSQDDGASSGATQKLDESSGGSSYTSGGGGGSGFSSSYSDNGASNFRFSDMSADDRNQIYAFFAGQLSRGLAEQVARRYGLSLERLSQVFYNKPSFVSYPTAPVRAKYG